MIKGQQVRILKDDGCNTNIVSTEFFEKNRYMFDVADANITISHSEKNTVETATKIIKAATVYVAGVAYTSNWAIASCRYDALFGMPWHTDTRPKVDYATREVWVGNTKLPLARFSIDDVARVSNISVKRFRSILRKRNKASFDLYSVSVPELAGLSGSYGVQNVQAHDL